MNMYTKSAIVVGSSVASTLAMRYFPFPVEAASSRPVEASVHPMVPDAKIRVFDRVDYGTDIGGNARNMKKMISEMIEK